MDERARIQLNWGKILLEGKHILMRWFSTLSSGLLRGHD